MAAVAALSGCGALSSPERSETPSALILKAQEAYDLGKYSEAVTLLEKVVAVDPRNEDARVRLAFSYNGSVGITPLNMIKNLTATTTPSSGGASANSDVTKLTNGSGLSAARTKEIKDQRAALTSVAILREKFSEFATFQKAFLALCPLLSTQTLTTLKEKVPTAETLMEVSKCNSGVSTSNANVSIAALSLSVEVFSTLYKSVLDTDGDGQIDAVKDSADASASLNNVNNLQAFTDATKKLTNVATTLKGEVFKLAVAQFSVIDAVILGSNLPSSVKDPLSKAVAGVNDAITKIDSYLSAGKATTTSATGGKAAEDAALKANQQATTLLKDKSPEDKQKACNQVYCFRTAYGFPTSGPTDMPSDCTASLGYSTTCTQ